MTTNLFDSYFRYKDASLNHSLKENEMTTRQQISDYLEEMGETTLLMDGFEDAFIGFSRRINEPVLAVYSYDKMVEVLMFRDGMSSNDATEFIDYNCVGAWVGEQTPIIVQSPPL